MSSSTVYVTEGGLSGGGGTNDSVVSMGTLLVIIGAVFFMTSFAYFITVRQKANRYRQYQPYDQTQQAHGTTVAQTKPITATDGEEFYNPVVASTSAVKQQPPAQSFDEEFYDPSKAKAAPAPAPFEEEEFYDPNKQKAPAVIQDEEFYDPNKAQAAPAPQVAEEEFYDPNAPKQPPARPTHPSPSKMGVVTQPPPGPVVPGDDFHHEFPEYFFNSDYKLKAEIFRVGGLVVYAAEAVHDSLKTFGGKLVVKKLADAAQHELNPRQNAGFEHECNLLWLLKDHPNFVKCLGISRQPVAIITKAYPRGSLNFFTASKAPFPHWLKLSFSKDIGNAVKFLHENALAFFDLKPSMILIDETPDKKLKLVLSEVSSIQVVDPVPYLITDYKGPNIKPTYAYLAPEAIFRYSKGVRPSMVSPGEIILGDIYSIAAIIYEFLERKRPFN